MERRYARYDLPKLQNNQWAGQRVLLQVWSTIIARFKAMALDWRRPAICVALENLHLTPHLKIHPSQPWRLGGSSPF
jgi:hypothetical protein